MKPPQLIGIHYLRGILAVIIMLYHYGFEVGYQRPSLSLLGIYSVSCFYIISGISLSYSYSNSKDFSVKPFLARRAFRIFPVFWLATILSIFIHGKQVNLTDLLLNFTGLFIVVPGHSYFADGAWSTGNFILFYVIFAIYFKSKNFVKMAIAVLSLLSISWISFFLLSPYHTLAEQFTLYTHPLNHLFLFIVGIYVFQYFAHKKISLLSLFVLNGISFYLIYRANVQSQIDMVTGFNRAFMLAVCGLNCLFFFKFNQVLPSFIDKMLNFTAHISFSIYLLHPIVWVVFQIITKKLNFDLPVLATVFFSAIITLIVSYLCYIFIEKPLVLLGKKKVLPSINRKQFG